MSEYTKTSDNIYFLNDKNIVSSLYDETVNLNPIASQKVVQNVYNKLYKDITAVSGNVSGYLSSLDCQDHVTEGGYILSSLSQEDGKIEYSVRKLLISDVENLLPTLTTISESCDVLNLTISSVNDDLSDHYFKNSGGDINGNTNIYGNAILSGSLYIDSNNAANTLKFTQMYKSGTEDPNLCTDFTIDETGIKMTVTNAGRKIKLSAYDSINDVLINDTSLCSYIENEGNLREQSAKAYTASEITKLSIDSTEFTDALVLKSISESNGIIAIETRELSIEQLKNSDLFVDRKVSDLCVELSGAVNSTIDAKGKELSSYINNKISIAYKAKGSVSAYSVLEKWEEEWKRLGDDECSVHIGEVWNVISASGKEQISGLNYVWVDLNKGIYAVHNWGWDNIGGLIDFSNYSTKAETSELIESAKSALSDDYIAKDNANVSALTSMISSNYKVLSVIDDKLREDINSISVELTSDSLSIILIQGYVDKLSTHEVVVDREGHKVHLGIIDTLSSDISAINTTSVKLLKFNHHIDYNKTSGLIYHFANLSDMFYKLDLYDSDSSKILNGSTIDVVLSSNSAKISVDSIPNFFIGNGDVLVIHDHENLTYVRLDSLAHEGNNKNLYHLKAGVSQYEFVEKYNDLSSKISNAKTIIDVGFSLISNITNESTYTECISAVVELTHLLSAISEKLA